MKERFQEIGKTLLKRLDQVAVFVFLGLLLFIGFLWYQENSEIAANIEDPPKRELANDVRGENFEKISAQFRQSNTDIQSNPQMQILIEQNMFDLKSVRDATEQDERLRDLLTQAEQQHEAGRTREATDTLNNILQRNPNYGRARQLLDRINEENQADAGNEADAASN